MRFYSGFSLQGEAELFADYLRPGRYTVAGFSKGAIEALRFAYESEERVDLLQLISPAFFMDKSSAFKRAQLHYFRKDPQGYIERFLGNVAYPGRSDLYRYLEPEGIEALQMLLSFDWPQEWLEEIVSRGTQIELYLGMRDKIIDPVAARAYFLPYATVYTIKEGGHILDG